MIREECPYCKGDLESCEHCDGTGVIEEEDCVCRFPDRKLYTNKCLACGESLFSVAKLEAATRSQKS